MRPKSGEFKLTHVLKTCLSNLTKRGHTCDLRDKLVRFGPEQQNVMKKI